jgi:hypothetical protein
VISSIKDHKVIMQETKAETARQVKKLECWLSKLRKELEGKTKPLGKMKIKLKKQRKQTKNRGKKRI